MKSGNNKWIIALVIIAILLIAFAAYKSRSKPRGIEVMTEKTIKRTIQETVSASGKVFPETEVKVSSDISGEIVELFIKEGDTVKVGQLLGKINADIYQSQTIRNEALVSNSQAQVENNKAGLKRAEAQLAQTIAQKDQILAQLENAKTIFQRNKELFNEGVISKVEFDNSKSSYDGLQANLASAEASIKSSKAGVESARQSVKAAQYSVKSAQAGLSEANTSLQRANIVAPMAGIISQLNVEQGERVVGTLQMTGTEMMRIADLSNIEVRVDVSENDILRVSLGDSVSIDVDAYMDKKFTGIVTEIANSASNSSATSLTTDQVINFIVKIRIDPSSYVDLIKKHNRFPFRPGMSASVDITTQTEKGVLAVPIQAVTTRDINQDYSKNAKSSKPQKATAKKEDIREVVFLMAGDTAQMVQVKTGIQDDKYIQITDGLSNEQEIIVGPYSAVSQKINSGKKLRLSENE